MKMEHILKDKLKNKAKNQKELIDNIINKKIKIKKYQLNVNL